MTARDILRGLVGDWTCCRWSPRKALCIANSSGISRWESDLLVIHPSGWVDEVEIKISVSDFRAEMTKKRAKHESLQRGYVCVAPTWRNRSFYTDGYPVGPSGYVEHKQIATIVRRFWLAMPLPVYEKVKDEIPAWMGVLTLVPFKPGGYGPPGYSQVTEQRKPKSLPSRKAEEKERRAALESIYYRSWKDSGTHSLFVETQSADGAEGGEVNA